MRSCFQSRLVNTPKWAEWKNAEVFLMNDPPTTPELWASADIKGSVILKDIQKQNGYTHIYHAKKKLITDYCFSCLCLVVASLRAETRDLLEPILVFERQRELIIEDLSQTSANIYSHNMSFPQHVTHYRSFVDKWKFLHLTHTY